MGEKKKLIHLSSRTGQRILEIPVDHLEDIAVDNHRKVVWVGTKKEIIRFGFDGAEELRYSLKIKKHSKETDDDDDEACHDENDDDDASCHGGGHRVRLSLDPFDGALWTGAKDAIVKIAFDGAERFRIESSGHVQDLSVDPSDGSAWVGLKRTAIKYSPEGTPLLFFHLESGDKVQALSADPLSQSLWIGTKKKLIKINEQGFRAFEDKGRSDIQDIAVDLFDPSLWGVGKKRVFKYNSEGILRFDLDPCKDREENEEDDDDHDDGDVDDEDDHGDADTTCKGNLITLAVDPSDGSAWIAWKKSLLKLIPSGLPLFWLDGFKQIQAIDIGLPEIGIQITEPADGSLTQVPSTTVKGTISDPSAKVFVNGVEATVEGLSFEVPNIALLPGNNTLTASVTNLAGLKASDAIDVVFQPPLSVRITSPIAGADFSISRIDVSGTVNDPNASVRVNGIEAIVSGNTFLASDVPLSLGANTLLADARDQNGFEASDTVQVDYRWLELSITTPLSGTRFTTSPIDVEGLVSDPQAIIDVNGVEAVVTPDGRFRAAGVDLQEGFNAIVARGFNRFGQSDSDTVVVSYVPTPLPLTISFLTPFDGSTLDVPRFQVRGLVSDPEAFVIVDDVPATVDEDGVFEATIFACEPAGPLPTALPEEEPGGPPGGIPGECTITVTAHSRDGRSASTIIRYTFVPSDDPLTVVITEPRDRQRFTQAPITVQGTVHDSLSGFTPTVVKVNGVVATVVGETFSALIPLADGFNDITVHAENLVGIDAYHGTVVLYEPATKPLTLQVTSPVEPFLVNHNPISVTGIVSDSAAVVEVSGIAAEQNFRSFKITSVPLSLGDNTLLVKALRPSGETVTSTLKVTYDPNAPSPPPPVLNPFPGLIGRESVINRDPDDGIGVSVFEVSGLTLPHHVVELFVNGSSVSSSVNAFIPALKGDENGFFKGTLVLFPEGPFHIAARAVDLSGNVSVLSPVTVVVKDTIPPHIKAEIRMNNAGLAAHLVEIHGRTDPFARVEIGSAFQPHTHFQLKANQRGKFSVKTHLVPGSYGLSITSTDLAGNVGVNRQTFHVVHTGITPFFGSLVALPPHIDPIPSPLNVDRVSVEGSAYRGAKVELYRNNRLIDTRNAGGSGRFLFPDISLLSGANSFKVRQKAYSACCREGGTTVFIEPSESSEVIVERVTGTPARPVIDIAFPIDGSVTDGLFLPLRGTVSDPAAEIRVIPTYAPGEGRARNLGGTFVSERMIPLIRGINTLWVEAISADGSRGVDKITVFSERDAEVPSVQLTSPTEGEETFNAFQSASGTVDPSVQKVIVNEAEAVITGTSFTS
ncbi:MAG: hypothetical protein ACE5GK_08305, partial [Nitrospiria bacterium]